MLERSTSDSRGGAEPMLSGEKSPMQGLLVTVFAVVPLLAVAAAVPVAWGWGLGWVDIGLAVFFYTLTCLGVTVGFHRYFTHGAFKARRGLRITLAAVGSTAMQGSVVGWVADHAVAGRGSRPGRGSAAGTGGSRCPPAHAGMLVGAVAAVITLLLFGAYLLYMHMSTHKGA